jgi:hypothetical protein
MPAEAKAPLHPYVILAVAIVLPGFGHVLCAQPTRGLVFQVFMILLGIVTWHLTTPDHSFVGRIAGGLFVYAISLPDAYRIARLRWAAWHRRA